MMDNRRQALLSQLEAVADKMPPMVEELSALCFQIMYGLPTELQLRAAVHMCERYLPIYEAKVPGSTWPRQLLGDLDAWVRTEGEATPEGPDDIDSADGGFQAGFTDLLGAYRYRDDPECLTSGTCSAIHGAIDARAKNVFLADDPIVIQFEKEYDAWWSTWGGVEEEHWPPQPESFSLSAQPEHNPSKNAAYQAVYRREWLYLVGWLRAEAVWRYPEPDDLNAITRALERWYDFAGHCMRPGMQMVV